jgi:hypothetical protein
MNGHVHSTVPLGHSYPEEVEKEGFKYDENLWSNFVTFMPKSVMLPEFSDPATMGAAYDRGELHIPDGPGSEDPEGTWIPGPGNSGALFLPCFVLAWGVMFAYL